MRHRVPKALLRAARALLGVSQQDVAASTGVSAGTIAHLENDKLSVKLETELVVRDYYESIGIRFVIGDDRNGVLLATVAAPTEAVEISAQSKEGPA
jgi:transcriptional regulator with XRE-family HTH domain